MHGQRYSLHTFTSSWEVAGGRGRRHRGLRQTTAGSLRGPNHPGGL
jgi:hypothetical protein